MSYADTETPAGKELKGWHVLLIMLGFFGVIFTVNGVFLYHAITTHPGEHVEKSYLQGLNYNDRLDVRALQAERGWQAAMGIENTALVAQIDDAEGQGVSRLAITALLRRTASNDPDVTVELNQVGNGAYAAELPELQSGAYEVELTAFEGSERQAVLEARKRLYVP
ncbi:MAG: FixH family protein [Pseudomonadota bacterium]